MNEQHPVRFASFVMKSIVAHTVTYFAAGALASYFLNYNELFARPEMSCWMRPVSDPMVMAGPLFQPVRGLVFALVLFPLREVLFRPRKGWLIMWWILVGLGILSTFGPAPGSLEGMVYTTIPLKQQLLGWLEVVPQALGLSALLFSWVNHPDKRWLDWFLFVLFCLMMALPALGLLASATTQR